MKPEELFSYLFEKDQLEELLGLKHDNIANCPECNDELLIYDNNFLYCPKCKKIEERIVKREIDNKKLTLEQKRMVIGRQNEN